MTNQGETNDGNDSRTDLRSGFDDEVDGPAGEVGDVSALCSVSGRRSDRTGYQMGFDRRNKLLSSPREELNEWLADTEAGFDTKYLLVVADQHQTYRDFCKDIGLVGYNPRVKFIPSLQSFRGWSAASSLLVVLTPVGDASQEKFERAVTVWNYR